MKKIVLFALLAGAVLAAAPGGAQELAPGRIAAFADHLFEQGDYYRAITEYERLLFLYPDHPLAKTARYQIALSYFKGDKLGEAIRRFREVADAYPDDAVGRRSLFMLGEAYARKNDQPQAIDVFERFLASYPNDERADEARIRIGWSCLREGSWQRAVEEFGRVPPGSSLRAQAEGLAEASKKYPEIPNKSPYLAGGLSAVVPGAGQLYVGRPRDAAISFLLNGAFIWATVESFKKDNNVTGGILLFFESGWYLGNIYSALNGAHKYNRDAKQNFLDSLSGQYALSYYRNDRGTSLLALTILF